jgi:hypothetical protein
VWKLHWLFRIGVFMEYVGHGCCGVNTKAAWLPYFRLFAIPDDFAWRLMPLIGFFDIALGIIALVTPRRALLLYMAGWGFFTALLRPATGEGGWEFLERAYNYGVPLAFLLLHGFGKNLRHWFAPLSAPQASSFRREESLLWLVQMIIAAMFIGHGALGAVQNKQSLLGLYQSIGLGSMGVPLESVRMYIGLFEIALGVIALFASSRAFFACLCIWKIGSEMLFVTSGAPLGCWEFVERGASYVAPLAVLCLLPLSQKFSLTMDGLLSRFSAIQNPNQNQT